MAAMTDTATMPIPGHIDPVPVPRAAPGRGDGKVDLLGLGREELRAALAAAGLEPKQAKLRAKQLWHWIYNRGVTDFALMTDIAKVQHPWLADELMRLFVASRDRSGETVPYGIDANRPAIELLMRYAAQQALIPRAYDVGELFVT